LLGVAVGAIGFILVSNKIVKWEITKWMEKLTT
jgi:hypothetical protein